MRRIFTQACSTLAVGAGLAGVTGITGAAGASEVYSVDYTFTFDQASITTAETSGFLLPDVFGNAMFDTAFLPTHPIGLNTLSFQNLGLTSLTISIQGYYTLDGPEDTAFITAPEARFEDDQFVGLSLEAEALGVQASILDDDFTVEGFGLEGGGTVEYLEAELLADCTVIDDVSPTAGGDGGSPSAVPTPSAAAAGLGLIALIAARRRREQGIAR